MSLVYVVWEMSDEHFQSGRIIRVFTNREAAEAHIDAHATTELDRYGKPVRIPVGWEIHAWRAREAA